MSCICLPRTVSPVTVRVFVSSTFNDLKLHRGHAIAQLRGAGLFVDPMEDWPAFAGETTAFCAEKVVGCEVVLLFVGFRRGG